MLRCENGARSQVIDVNGWSFVKGNESYYGGCISSTAKRERHIMFLPLIHISDKAAEILSALCTRLSTALDRPLISSESAAPDAPTWLLKANVTVFRHADRTPKQKQEIILREREQLSRIAVAVEEAKRLGADGEDLNKLTLLNNALFSKIELPGTKAQLKPVYSKKAAGQPRKLSKLTLVFKWGGEFTHSARYQSRDLGENMKKDISIMSAFIINFDECAWGS